MIDKEQETEEYIAELEGFIQNFINHTKSDLINLESSYYLLDEARTVLGITEDCHD